MNGQKGFVKIKLGKPTVPSGFAYEHLLRRSILQENQVTCSPKLFSVFGYKEESSEESIFLGNFQYVFSEEETEFAFENVSTLMSVIQINIEANHGNADFTCLHKIKVF